MPLAPEYQAMFEELAQQPPAPPLWELTPEQGREMYRMMRPVNPDLPIHHVEDRMVPGTQGDIPVRVYTPAGEGPFGVLVYFHGGGYVGGVLKTYHNLASRLAKRLGGEVYLPVYPFAPEHPFPHAVNRVFSAYEFLLAQGKEPHNIVIAGDSAGGGLTLATLLQIRDKGLPQPRCAIAFSPGTNALPDDTTLAQRDRSDAMLSADIIRGVLEAYLPDTSQRTHAYANPASADYTGICPLLITVSSEEVLYDDSVRVKQQAQKAGIPVRWIERPGLFHVWPIMVPFLPEANRELKNVVGFIHQHATR